MRAPCRSLEQSTRLADQVPFCWTRPPEPWPARPWRLPPSTIVHLTATEWAPLARLWVSTACGISSGEQQLPADRLTVSLGRGRAAAAGRPRRQPAPGTAPVLASAIDLGALSSCSSSRSIAVPAGKRGGGINEICLLRATNTGPGMLESGMKAVARPAGSLPSTKQRTKVDLRWHRGPL